MMQQQPRGAYPMPSYGINQQAGRSGRMPNQGRGGVPGRGQPGIKFNQQARNAGPTSMGPIPTNQVPPQQAQVQQPPVVTPPAPHEPLTAAALASASPEMQKN